MARSILVLILAAVPALAQYNANTYNVRPSGGSVGQVCFYETAANGSNKFCITGVSSLSGDSSVSVASLGGNFDYTPTAYNNTTWEHALHVSVNGADAQTIIQGIQGAGQFTADGINVAHDCPSTATNWECGALSGVLSHGSVTTNAVALRGYVVQSANGTGTANNQRVKGWGLNTLFADAGFDYGYGITEFDYNIDGADTKVIGVSVGGNGTGTISGDSAGFVCNTLNVPQWPVCFTALDGTSAVFMSAGTTGTGNNVGSQPIYFYGRNSGGVTQRGSLKVDANGNTILEAGAFASPVEFAVLADGSISVLGNVNINAGHILFAGASANDIATSTNYGQTIYMENADFAPTGITNNWTQVRKLEVVDAGGGDTFWDIQSTANGTINTVLYFRDNAGEQIMRLVRRESSADTRQAQFTLSLVPGNNSTNADNTYDVGTSARSWKDGYFDGTLYVNNLTVSGTCNVCGGYWSRAATTLSPTTAGDGIDVFTLAVNAVTRINSSGVGNLASLQIGGTEVLTSSRYWTGSLNFEPGTDNNVTLGTTSRRWYGITASNNLSVYDGSYYRVSANTGGLFLRNSSGTTKVSLDSASGQITGDSYYVGANLLSNGSRDLTVNSVTWPSSFASVTSSGNATFLATSVSSLSIGSGGSISLNGTTRLDSSGNFRANNMRVDSQLHLTYTDDNVWTIGSTTTTAKLAIYDTSGAFIGWVPVFP